MVYQGTVQNGVIVFEPGVRLPEGAPVRVEVVESDSRNDASGPPEGSDNILFQMSEYAVETGIPDLGVNIDHYLYGHPKVTDGK